MILLCIEAKSVHLFLDAARVKVKNKRVWAHPMSCNYIFMSKDVFCTKLFNLKILQANGELIKCQTGVNSDIGIVRIIQFIIYFLVKCQENGLIRIKSI